MKVVTSSQMQEIDRVSIEEIGIPSLVLMERAGLAVVRRIKECYEGSPVVVVAGGGNNGGDGLVVARELFRQGYDVTAFVTTERERLSEDCRSQLEIAERIGVPVRVNQLPKIQHLRGRLIVDALFGTGLNRPIREPLSTLIERINRAGTQVVAVDIPSGVSADTGGVLGIAVRADITVTFGLPKVGHLLYPGRHYTGRLYVEDIGFPEALLQSDSIKTELVEAPQVRSALPYRDPAGHKGTFGHVLVVGGSVGKTGAALMTARASLKIGAGLVTVGIPEDALGGLSVVEEMTLPLPSTPVGTVSREATEEILRFIHERADVLAVGPGLGRQEETMELVVEVIRGSTVPVVVDADALYALSRLGKGVYDFLYNEVSSPLVLTPHPAEMGRLLSRDAREVDRDRLEVARYFAARTGMCVVLKGAPTVVASPEEYCYINSTGGSSLATAGSGDILTGMIAGLIAQGVAPLEAAIAGVWLHGLAGDIGASKVTEYSFTASDILTFLPEALKSLLKTCSTSLSCT